MKSQLLPLSYLLLFSFYNFPKSTTHFVITKKIASNLLRYISPKRFNNFMETFS